MSEGAHVAVMVCTRGRADVRRLCLAAIGRLSVAPGVQVTVVVGDNNSPADGDIEREVAATGFPYLIARDERRGYCFIRNAVVTAALESDADIFIFIDDDHAVEPDVISAYLQAFERFGADVVHGSYVGSSRSYREGQRARKVATYNVAFRRRLVASEEDGGLGLRFDGRLNLIGREDVEFFRDAAGRGATLIYSELARTRLIEARQDVATSASVPLSVAYAEGRNATYVERMRRGRLSSVGLFVKSYVRKALGGLIAGLGGGRRGRWDFEIARGAFDGVFKGGVERPAAKAGRIVELEPSSERG